MFSPDSRRLLRFISVATAGLILLTATDSSAQDHSSWGVTGSVTPRWESFQPFVNLFDKFLDADIQLKGRDFTIGLVRGRTLGGDWGVSYFRRAVDDTSTLTRMEDFCYTLAVTENIKTECLPSGTSYLLRDTRLSGLEFHRFVPFATIKQRVQVGMTFGGGIAWAQGTAEKRVLRPSVHPISFDNFTLEQNETIQTVDAKDALQDATGLSILPTGRVEITVAAIIARGLKLKVGGGLNLPGRHVASVSFVYLVGQ